MKIYKTFQHFLKKYRNNEENSIDYETAKNILKSDKYAILLDVRSPQEYKEYHLDGSINYPLYDLERECEKLSYNKENTIIVYCQSGYRSKRALKNLEKNGYINLYEIKGGLDEI